MPVSPERHEGGSVLSSAVILFPQRTWRNSWRRRKLRGRSYSSRRSRPRPRSRNWRMRSWSWTIRTISCRRRVGRGVCVQTTGPSGTGTADYFPFLAKHEVLRAEPRVTSSSDRVALRPLSGCRCAVDQVPGGLFSARAATEQVSATLRPMETPGHAKGANARETPGPLPRPHGPVSHREAAVLACPGRRGFWDVGLSAAKLGKSQCKPGRAGHPSE